MSSILYSNFAKLDLGQGSDNVSNCKKAVLFDLDGTLVDTDYANFLAYKNALEKVLNKSVDLEYKNSKRLNSYSLRELFPQLSEFQFKRVSKIKADIFCNFLPETQIIKAVAEHLYQLDKNCEAVLVTKAKKGRAIQVLQFHNLTKHFSFIFCAEDRSFKENKYLHAIKSLNISHQNAEVFENESEQIRDAIYAGISNKNINFVGVTQ